MVGKLASFRSVRRVVTGHDAEGRSIIRSDVAIRDHETDQADRRSTLLWATKEMPADFLNQEDAGSWSVGIVPPGNGTLCRVIQLMPGTARRFHRTDTVDYAICVAGEITMDVDGDAVVLSSGDVLIQMGTNHRWRNEGTEIACVVFILIDGKPKSPPELPPSRL